MISHVHPLQSGFTLNVALFVAAAFLLNAIFGFRVQANREWSCQLADDKAGNPPAEGTKLLLQLSKRYDNGFFFPGLTQVTLFDAKSD
jgi:hypothetical protein